MRPARDVRLRWRTVIALVFWAICRPLAAAAPGPGLDLAPHWRLLGPFRGGWAEMVEGVVGRPDTFVFGAAGGGAWRTDDAGRAWTPLFDKGPTAPIGALAIAPSDPE